MDWHILKENIYYSDGSWRDIYIHDTTLRDWEKWVTFVNQNYKIEFYNGQTQQTETKIDYSLIFDFWEHKTEFLNSSIINIDNIKVNCHFFNVHEIENDIDPSVIETINDHDKMIKYMMDLSKLLYKRVLMTAENMPEHIYISVDKDIVEIHNH
jgi:hypothetical protein